VLVERLRLNICRPGALEGLTKKFKKQAAVLLLQRLVLLTYIDRKDPAKARKLSELYQKRFLCNPLLLVYIRTLVPCLAATSDSESDISDV
jgi:hypothetical protein